MYTGRRRWTLKTGKSGRPRSTSKMGILRRKQRKERVKRALEWMRSKLIDCERNERVMQTTWNAGRELEMDTDDDDDDDDERLRVSSMSPFAAALENGTDDDAGPSSSKKKAKERVEKQGMHIIDFLSGNNALPDPPLPDPPLPDPPRELPRDSIAQLLAEYTKQRTNMQMCKKDLWYRLPEHVRVRLVSSLEASREDDTTDHENARGVNDLAPVEHEADSNERDRDLNTNGLIDKDPEPVDVNFINMWFTWSRNSGVLRNMIGISS